MSIPSETGAVAHLGDAAVRRAIGETDLRPTLADMVRRVAAGSVECAPRSGVGHGPLGQVTHLMLARDNARGDVVTKLVDYDPTRLLSSGRPSVMGVVTYMLNGDTLFTASAASFTAIRTAACTAFAIDLLARPGPVKAAIVGAGVQAYDHALRLSQVRELRELCIVGRSQGKLEALAARLRVEMPGVAINTGDDVHRACAHADVVITVTTAVEPIVFAADVKPGACVALVGAGVPSRREAGADLLGTAGRVVVESFDVAWAEAGDLILAEGEGRIDRNVTVDLATILHGPPVWRDDEVSIYKSVGAAWQDLACARQVAVALSEPVSHLPASER